MRRDIAPAVGVRRPDLERGGPASRGRPLRPESGWRLPFAAGLLDAVTLGLAALSLVILVTGGWRANLFGIAVSMHASWRPLAWAAAAAAARHLFVPHPSLVQRLREGALFGGRLLASSQWSSAFAAALGPVLLSRAMVYTIGLFALAAIGLEAGATPSGGGRFLDMLLRWDANWYADIASNGYAWNGDPRLENPVVFFPAYPMLMRAGAWLTGSHPAYAGFAISMMAFAWAMAYVYRIARDQFRLESPETALALLAWYPFAVFFGAVYTESLFLLAVAGAFYHAREGGRLQTAGWALLASLAKPNGVFVALPLAVMFGLRLVREARARPRGWRDGGVLRGAAADALVLVVPAVGVAAYSLYLWGVTGDPLAWLHGQEAWGRVFRGPIALLQAAQARLGRGLVQAIAIAPSDVLNGAAAVFALASIVPIFFRLGAPYAVLVAVMVVPPLLGGGTISMGRFSSCLFPVFIWLAVELPPSRRAACCAVFAAGQALAAILFLTWRPLF